jgi:hypothetical protein
VIQEHHVDSVRLEGKGQFMSEASLDLPSIGVTIDEQCQVIIAHGTQIAVDLGTEQIDQADFLQVSQYG